jgi:DNA-binding GntR family transcriptional regulator
MKDSYFNSAFDITDIVEKKQTIDKQSSMPAYAQLATILRQHISDGTYPPGERLPSEASLAKSYGLSAMTTRQAVGVLAEEGLVDRIQGRGTFIKKIEVSTSNFGLESLRAILTDKKNLEVRILKATVEKAQSSLQSTLMLPINSPVIVVERLISYQGNPFTLQIGYARFDPESPIVETMLDTDELTGLFFKQGHSCFMKGELRLLPAMPDEREAGLLKTGKGTPVFKIEHIFYDFSDQPTAFGWFLFSPGKMPMISRLGVWHE